MCCVLIRSVAVVGADGSFFKANFEKGGEAIRVAYSQFVNKPADAGDAFTN
jgi:hypothetical protein